MREERETYILTNELVELNIYETAQFIWYSEPGGMGAAGEVLMVTDDGEIVHGDYLNGDFTFDLLAKKFPYISEKGMDYLLKHGHSEDNEIYYFYLENGNHLFVRENVYEFFIELNAGEKDYVQGDWLEMAERICPDDRRRKKLDEIMFFCKELRLKTPKIYPFGTDEELEDFISCWREYDPLPELK